jgi:hypothetical protein
MPFNSSGVYTPATGATTAAPGDVIRSATWNAIFQDITDALTLLGEQLYHVTSVTATPYVPVAADAFLAVNVAGAAVVNLPSAASRSGFPLAIKDISGNANTNNITINRNGTDTIEGATSIVINSSWGGWNLYPVTGGWVLRP